MKKENQILARSMNVFLDLEAVIGKGPMTKKEACDKLWGYIEKNSLVDQTSKNSIVADEKLRRVFGGRTEVSHQEMTKLVSDHLA